MLITDRLLFNIRKTFLIILVILLSNGWLLEEQSPLSWKLSNIDTYLDLQRKKMLSYSPMTSNQKTGTPSVSHILAQAPLCGWYPNTTG